MMKLYLMRHGDALPLGGENRRDADRPLTPGGEEDVRRIAAVLARLDGEVRLLLCSPLLRARQTAALLAAALGGGAEVRPSENLSPGFRPASLLEELETSAGGRSVAVVGHQPDLSVLLATLIDGESATALAMPPGAMACVSFAAGTTSEATLHWLLTPELLRRALAQE